MFDIIVDGPTDGPTLPPPLVPTDENTSSPPTVNKTTVLPSKTDSTQLSSPSTTTPPTNATSSNQAPSIALIIGAVLIGLVVVTLLVLVIILVVKYHQLRSGKKSTHLDNPTYQGKSSDMQAREGRSEGGRGETGSLEACRCMSCQGEILNHDFNSIKGILPKV